MKKKSGIKSIASSVQLKFALVFLGLIAGLLVMLNIYPTIITRDSTFSSKESSFRNQAGVISSALSTMEDLTPDTVSEVMGLIDIGAITRVIVTDENAVALYDTAELDPAIGRYVLFSEVAMALEGKVVCRSVYDGRAFMTSQGTPVSRDGVIKGSIYLYEYDSQQAQLISVVQRNLRNITFILGIVSIILMLIFSRALTFRITELARATRIVSGGNYDYRIAVKGNDELSELGDEFNALTQRLKETEELRRRFVSDASHELKTPLASIRLLSDSIVTSDNMSMDTMRDFVTDIGNEAERLQRTAEKLLSLSKIDSGADLGFETYEFKDIVERTLRLLEPLAAENRVTIETELDSGCTVLGNEDLLYRVVFNLAENGIKYNVPEGRVFLRLSRDGDCVVLTVEDTGIGIPDEDLPHIFSRFYRVDKARSREAGGSGLGLSIVHDAVELHGGKIRVEKLPEGGSRFVVTLPYWSEQEEEK